MLRRDRQMRMQAHQLVDACLFALGFWLAYELRSSEHVIRFFRLHEEPSSFKDFAWLLAVLIPAAPFVLEAQGFYDRPMLGSRRTMLWQLLKGCAFTTLGLILTLFFFKMLIARWVLIWFGVISFVLVVIKEEVWRLICRSKMAQAQYQRRFLLVGNREETARMRSELEARGEKDLRVVAELDLNESSVEQLVRLLHEHSVNGVILSAKHAYFEQVEAAIRACELEGVEAWLVADFFKTQISRTSFDDFYGRPVLVFRSTPDASWQSVVKQVMDFVGALLCCSLCLPWLLALVALLIKLTSPGPVLFRQQRSGLNGRPFTIYKFRTMVTNAEQLKHELAAMNEMSGPVFKVTNDPRDHADRQDPAQVQHRRVPAALQCAARRDEPGRPAPAAGGRSEALRRPGASPPAERQAGPDLPLADQRAQQRDAISRTGCGWIWNTLTTGRSGSTLKILWRTVPVVLAGTGAK